MSGRNPLEPYLEHEPCLSRRMKEDPDSINPDLLYHCLVRARRPDKYDWRVGVCGYLATLASEDGHIIFSDFSQPCAETMGDVIKNMHVPYLNGQPKSDAA